MNQSVTNFILLKVKICHHFLKINLNKSGCGYSEEGHSVIRKEEQKEERVKELWVAQKGIVRRAK